jgi:hypothetical protein
VNARTLAAHPRRPSHVRVEVLVVRPFQSLHVPVLLSEILLLQLYEQTLAEPNENELDRNLCVYLPSEMKSI